MLRIRRRLFSQAIFCVVLRPCMSPCRSDYIIFARVSREARRVVSEGTRCDRVFPADCPHRMDYHSIPDRVPPDARIFQHIARFVDGTTKPLMI
jgi:hypothetical protein